MSLQDRGQRDWLQALGAQCRLLGLRLLLAMALYSAARAFFYLYNKDLLDVSSTAQLGRMFVGGLYFDLSALSYTHVLLGVLSLLPLACTFRRGYQRFLSALYLTVNSLALILNLGDAVYYRFTFKRTTSSVFAEFGNENPLHFLRFFVDYWGVTLTGLGLILLLVVVDRRLPRPAAAPRARLLSYRLAGSLALIVTVALAVIGMRGGSAGTTRPITLSNAAIYIEQPQQRALVLNTPFCLIRTLGKEALPEYRYFSEAEARQYFDPIYRPGGTPRSGSFRGRNVVLIIWESFAREWVGGLNRDVPGYRGYTPFIDSLMQRSYVFEEAYANGSKSIDAMPSILTSLLKPRSPFILSVYSGNELPSLPARLDSMGYTTAFFHGAPNGSMGFDAFVKQAGVRRYYGMTEYGHDADYDGHWGIWDEPFLQYMARELTQLPEPFFSTVFTLSSHHPFRVPDQYKGQLPKGEIPYHQSIAYTDLALRRFFETASRQPWYQRTLFVLVADHAVPGVLREYKTSAGAFRVPIILFDPSGELQGREAEAVVSQSDIYPTILDLVGDERPMIAFGSSVFDASRPRFAVNYMDGVYQMEEGQWLLQYDGEKVLALYDLKRDRLQQHDLKGRPGTPEQTMLRRLQAYLQTYSQRMRENKLTLVAPLEPTAQAVHTPSH